MTDTVTREQAEAVLRLVEKKFRHYLKTFGTHPNGQIDFETLVDVPESERPVLVEGWSDTGTWAIVWESGSPSEWAYADLADDYVDEELTTQLVQEFGAKPGNPVTTKGVQGMPEGVYTEAYYSFVLVIYPNGR